MQGMPVEFEILKKKCKLTTRTRKLQVPSVDMSEQKIKLMQLEMKNAKLAEEKLRLEILVNKTRLEYYRKRNANKLLSKKDRKESIKP